MCCPSCGSENIISETDYILESGQKIGDEEDPCINCKDCGAIDISVNFKDL